MDSDKKGKSTKTTAKLTTKTTIDDQIVSTVMPLLSQKMDVSYAALGAQILQVESPYFAVVQSLQQQAPAAALNLGISKKINLKSKAYEFIKKYWQKMLKVVCPWWNRNKEKQGKELVKGIALVIVPVLPPPFNLVQGLIVLIAVILIQHGLNKSCIQKLMPKP